MLLWNALGNYLRKDQTVHPLSASLQSNATSSLGKLRSAVCGWSLAILSIKGNFAHLDFGTVMTPQKEFVAFKAKLRLTLPAARLVKSSWLKECYWAKVDHINASGAVSAPLSQSVFWAAFVKKEEPIISSFFHVFHESEWLPSCVNWCFSFGSRAAEIFFNNPSSVMKLKKYKTFWECLVHRQRGCVVERSTLRRPEVFAVLLPTMNFPQPHIWRTWVTCFVIRWRMVAMVIFSVETWSSLQRVFAERLHRQCSPWWRWSRSWKWERDV